MLGEQAGGQAFQHSADSVKIPRLLEGESADHRSFVRNNLDEALGFELAQSFADHSAGDAHHRNEFAFDEALAGIEPARDDGLAKFLENLTAERSRGFGDGGEGSGGGRRA